jgi:hypothetical protein
MCRIKEGKSVKVKEQRANRKRKFKVKKKERERRIARGRSTSLCVRVRVFTCNFFSNAMFFFVSHYVCPTVCLLLVHARHKRLVGDAPWAHFLFSSGASPLSSFSSSSSSFPFSCSW